MKPQYQKFAELLAVGETSAKAYLVAYNKPVMTNAVASAGQRLATNPEIRSKVKALQERAAAESEAAAIMTIKEKRVFLAQILRTDVTTLDPKKNAHLIKKVTRKMLGIGEMAEVILEIEGYDKIKAIETDTELSGDGSTNEFSRAFLDLLKGVPSSGAIQPTDTM